MNESNESSHRVVIVGGSPTDTAMLRATLSGHCHVLVADRQPSLANCTSSAVWTQADQAEYVRREDARERTAWNDAVDAKKASRRQSRAERSRSSE